MPTTVVSKSVTSASPVNLDFTLPGFGQVKGALFMFGQGNVNDSSASWMSHSWGIYSDQPGSLLQYSASVRSNNASTTQQYVSQTNMSHVLNLANNSSTSSIWTAQASPITDGVRLTKTTGSWTNGYIVAMFFSAEWKVWGSFNVGSGTVALTVGFKPNLIFQLNSAGGLNSRVSGRSHFGLGVWARSNKASDAARQHLATHTAWVPSATQVAGYDNMMGLSCSSSLAGAPTGRSSIINPTVNGFTSQVTGTLNGARIWLALESPEGEDCDVRYLTMKPGEDLIQQNMLIGTPVTTLCWGLANIPDMNIDYSNTTGGGTSPGRITAAYHMASLGQPQQGISLYVDAGASPNATGGMSSQNFSFVNPDSVTTRYQAFGPIVPIPGGITASALAPAPLKGQGWVLGISGPSSGKTLYYGDTEVPQVNYGTTPVNEIYYGSTKVFG